MAVPSRAAGLSALVDARIQRALRDLGWAPAPLHLQVIPALAMGRDLVAQADPGPRTTAAFGIPMLQRLDPRSKAVQGLVLAATRDHARQVARDLGRLAAHTRLRIAAVYGGEPVARQVARLREKPHIVVGTPSRVLDHLGHATLPSGASTCWCWTTRGRCWRWGSGPRWNRSSSARPPPGRRCSFPRDSPTRSGPWWAGTCGPPSGSRRSPRGRPPCRRGREPSPRRS